MFPQASAGDGLIWIHMANTRRLAGAGASVGWLTCQEAQICRDADRLWNVYAPQLGLQKKFSDSVSVFQPDFTAQCLRAKNAGVKWLLLGTDANSIRRIGASCEQQDYHPRYAVLQTSDEMGQERGLDGGYYAASTFPWVATDSPARREFHAVMSRYAPDAVLSAHATSGWAAAKLFEKVARRIGAPFTSARLLEGLWSIRNETLGGLTPSITFRRNSTAVPEYCYFPLELRQGRWITTNGGSLFCTPPPK
jgi:branched-chain amino acid transport system substrate-binding protein